MLATKYFIKVTARSSTRWCSTDHRINPVGIQMLSSSLHKQLFGQMAIKGPTGDQSDVKSHLTNHNLWGKPTDIQPDFEFSLPKINGNNIEEHMVNITLDLYKPYIELADRISTFTPPEMPKEFVKSAGWHRYETDGRTTAVNYPPEKAMVFDVETYVAGNYPMMAVALAENHWYSWVSERLIHDKFIYCIREPRLRELIPLESNKAESSPPSLVLGHNVGYDRSYIREQYNIEKSGMRFLDTMSIHIALHGFTSFQRVVFMAKQKGKTVNTNNRRNNSHANDGFEWMNTGSLNNLNDVHQLHCGAEPLHKESRNVFVEGTIAEITEQFQELMNYCANDTLATLNVYKEMWKSFRNHFPNPITFAGMLEMGTAYLPVNSNWDRYLERSEKHFKDLQNEMSTELSKIADEACAKFGQNESYKNDPWLYDIDWSTSDFKLLKKPRKGQENESVDHSLHPVVQRVLKTKNRLPKVLPHMPGVPNWYRELNPRMNDENWRRGPSLLTMSKRITPKLLKLTWDGYPLYHHMKHGWGYIVPYADDSIYRIEDTNQESNLQYPYWSARSLLFKKLKSETGDDKLLDRNLQNWIERNMERLSLTFKESERIWKDIGLASDDKKKRFSRLEKTDPSEGPSWHQGIGPVADVQVPGGWFFKLPHKDGEHKNVGNPLSRDFESKIEDGILSSAGGNNAQRVLDLGRKCSYWRNNKDRISSQTVMWTDHADLSSHIKQHRSYDEDFKYGAILPRIVTAGTVTRRSTEQTWLTASNARVDRIGSELKSLIQSPPGYCFVGADVDSQELWIASLLGDANFAQMHGCTALGWMTLQGKKSEGTDLHSKTAQLVGISRHEAKIFNYARIYGAGKHFAEKLLTQFDPKLTKEQAKEKADLMFKTTKGQKKSEFPTRKYPKKWVGGSESYMFNRLEEIANSRSPRTPVLRCKISQSLLPENVQGEFSTSRINWVVQSSAVDFLHIMLVTMNWLFKIYNIRGRFCLSIHDEVRYLVHEEDKYKAALALHLTNLYTRSLFSYKLGIYDLPQSVAFFSAVDIDKCLRKEVDDDCKTPSNIYGMKECYNIPTGESLDIYQVLNIIKHSNSTLQNNEEITDTV